MVTEQNLIISLKDKTNKQQNKFIRILQLKMTISLFQVYFNPKTMKKAEEQSISTLYFQNQTAKYIIFYRMSQYEPQKMQLQLIDSTSIFNKQINCNCFFDGYNLVYLGGAHIVFHNVFQNNKLFLERYTTNEAQAIAFHKSSSDLSIAIVARGPLCFIEFYQDGKKATKIDLYEELEIIDLKFIEKKKCCLLAFDKNKKTTSIYIVSVNKKVNKIDLTSPAHKLINSEAKVFILMEKGLLQFDIESECLIKQKRFENITIKDILPLQDGKGVIFDRENNFYYYNQSKIIQKGHLGQHFNRKIEYKSCIKFGKNILISIKDQFRIVQFQYDENKIMFVNDFEYSQKVKGSIIGMNFYGDQLNLAIAFQNQYKEQSRVEHYLFNLSILSNQRKFINPFTRLVQGGIDHGQVVGLQLTIPSEVYYMSGPYVVNYGYVDHIEKKHKYSIHENPRFIAVHPLGHQILCIFQTAIKFRQKVQNQLIQIWTEAFICNSASYTDSGLLVLCIYQQGSYEILLYDSNYFKVLHKFNGIYLKNSIMRIAFDENESQLILYSQKDLFVYKFKTGQKLSEFRQKRQITEASCIEYDSVRKCLLVATKNNLVVCRKNEQYCLNFNSHKSIEIGHEIICFHLNQNSQTIFMGTSDGQILYTEYPLMITEETQNDQSKFKISFKSIKIHTNPVTSILATLDGKHLFSSIKGQGLCILKIKYMSGRKAGNFNHFDISNYNVIQTSSKSHLELMQQKLKGLLQKRKTIFNELDQFKKQWQIKRINETNVINTTNKRRELLQINVTLSEINRNKLEHQAILDELSKFQKSIESSKIQNVKKHEKELLKCYGQNDVLKERLQEITLKCSKQMIELKDQCRENLRDISEELQGKFRAFEQNYNIMKDNLLNYKKKMDFQIQENAATNILESEYMKESLIKEEEQLYRCNHEIKGEIARNKKQIERFMNRRDFLQNKRRFFVEEINLCKIQEAQMKEVKSDLEEQLYDLENITHKKQKKLRKYFMENDILVKYQFIHDKIQMQTNKEIQFIENQHKKLRQNIGQLQKQILFISSERDNHELSLKSKQKALISLKEQSSKINNKREFLQFQIKQLDNEIFKIDNNNNIEQQQKTEYYTKIYQKFFIDKKLQLILSHKEMKQNEQIHQENKANEKGIHNILIDHKEYLINNMGLLEQYNTRANEQINHSYLKYQNQNYNFISQCNDKKEQISDKKRILHDLAHEMQKTNKVISQIHLSSSIKEKKIDNGIKKDIPFVVYEKKIQEDKVMIRKEQSESSLWKLKQSSYQVRKMLEIQKLKSPDDKEPMRRIQTAKLMKKVKETSNQYLYQDSVQNFNEFVYEERKPRTAGTAVRRYHKKQNLQAKRIFSRNKSNSKPTNCSTVMTKNGSKSKYSVFY